MKADTLATADIVVVGAGIAGLCTAWELRRRGFDVVVVDQRFASFGATGRNPGSVWLQLRRSGTELALARAGRQKYEDYVAELGDVFEYRNHGGLFFFETEEQQKVLEDYVADRRDSGLEIGMIGRDEALDRSPILPDTAVGAVYCADDAQIDAQQFSSALSAASTRAGVRIFDNTSVLSCIRERDSVVGVRTVRGEIHASGVVWATGAWSATLRAEGIAVPIETSRLGQLVTQPVDTRASAMMHGPRGVYGCGALTDLPSFSAAAFAPPAPDGGEVAVAASATSSETGTGGSARRRPETLLLEYDDCIAQNRGGSMYIGTSIDGRGSLNPHISMNATRAMVDMTVDRYERFADYGVTGLWAGLGSTTSDHLPIVDRADGIYLNVGHAWGIASGPTCGQILAQIIAGETTSLASELKADRPSLEIPIHT